MQTMRIPFLLLTTPLPSPHRPVPANNLKKNRLLVNFDCTAMWVKRSTYLVDALSVTPEILRSKEYNNNQVSDFRDWQVRGVFF